MGGSDSIPPRHRITGKVEEAARGATSSGIEGKQYGLLWKQQRQSEVHSKLNHRTRNKNENAKKDLPVKDDESDNKNPKFETKNKIIDKSKIENKSKKNPLN